MSPSESLSESPLESPSNLALFDSHCHFDFAAFDEDRVQVWQHCQSLGIKNAVVPGVAPNQWASARQVSAELPGIYHAASIHPWWLAEVWPEQQTEQDALAERLLEALNAPGCVAMGECGLDGAIETPMDLQLQALTWHLELAQQTQRPVILHCRKADHLLQPLLKKFALPQGGVIHAFSGSQQVAEGYWELGFYLGIGGTITYSRAHKTRRTVQSMPLEALVLESDAPDMPLAGRQGQRNSPEYLPEVMRALAELLGKNEIAVAEQTTANAQRLFRLQE